MWCANPVQKGIPTMNAKVTVIESSTTAAAQGATAAPQTTPAQKGAHPKQETPQSHKAHKRGKAKAAAPHKAAIPFECWARRLNKGKGACAKPPAPSRFLSPSFCSPTTNNISPTGQLSSWCAVEPPARGIESREAVSGEGGGARGR